MHHLIKDLSRIIKKRGIYHTFLFALYEMVYLYKYPINILSRRPLKDCNISSPNIINGKGYQSASVYLLLRTLKKVRVFLDFQNSVFIDFGSGKGKVLKIVNQFGFKKIIGIEFAADLFSICEKNLHNELAKKDNILLIKSDAAKYEIPSDANILFFYNPFNEIVLNEVLKKIDSSLESNPRNIFIIYINPVYHQLFLNQKYSVVDSMTSKNIVEYYVFSKYNT